MTDIDALRHEVRAWRAQQHEESAEILQRLAALETSVATERERCPYREDIARSKNNRDQIEQNRDNIVSLGRDLTAVRVKMAGVAAGVGTLTGGAGAIITGVLMKVLGI